MSHGIPTPLISTAGDDRQALGDAVAARVAGLPHRPRLLGFGEPMHGEDEFGRLRNAVFVGLVERAGFTSIALETSAWQARVVDAYVGGGDGSEDDVMATGFSHGFGESDANRLLVRWMREQNRHRPRAGRLRFAGFDAPTEMAWAPSPRPMLHVLHEFLTARAGDEVDVLPWEVVDRLLGSEEPWVEPAAVMEPARSVGAEPRVHELRAITDDLRWTLLGGMPGLRHATGPDDVEDVLLAGRTAAGLLAYHAAMAQDTEHRWQRLAAVRDTMMAENLQAVADRGPTMVFAHNAHLRTGSTTVSMGPTTLCWQPAGAHLHDRMGSDYRVIACALGDAAHQGIPEPEPDTVEGALHRGLPPGNHLLSAPALRALDRRWTPRVSPTYRYIPFDDTLLDQVDEVLFVGSVTPGTAASGAG